MEFNVVNVEPGPGSATPAGRRDTRALQRNAYMRQQVCACQACMRIKEAERRQTHVIESDSHEALLQLSASLSAHGIITDPGLAGSLPRLTPSRPPTTGLDPLAWHSRRSAASISSHRMHAATPTGARTVEAHTPGCNAPVGATGATMHVPAPLSP